MAIEESDASVFGDWYIWARAEVSFVPSRAKAAAWSAFKAAQAGRDSDQAAQFGKAVARSHQAREVEQRIEPHLSQYADWLAWAIDAVGASGKAAHVAARSGMAAAASGADQTERLLVAQRAAGLQLVPFVPANPRFRRWRQ